MPEEIQAFFTRIEYLVWKLLFLPDFKQQLFLSKKHERELQKGLEPTKPLSHHEYSTFIPIVPYCHALVSDPIIATNPQNPVANRPKCRHVAIRDLQTHELSLALHAALNSVL